MGRYAKLWASLAGTVGVALISFDIVDAGQWQAITTAGVSLLSAFGVYQLSNRA